MKKTYNNDKPIEYFMPKRFYADMPRRMKRFGAVIGVFSSGRTCQCFSPSRTNKPTGNTSNEKNYLADTNSVHFK